MRKISAFLFVISVIFTCFTDYSFAQDKDKKTFEIRDKTSYLFDVRGDDGDILLNHFCLHKNIESIKTGLFAFSELQWSFETSDWEKITMGIGAEKTLWNYLYASQTIQLISGQILDHIDLKTDNISYDATSRIGLYVTLPKNFALDIFEEYSYNIEEGKEEYCESVAELIYNFKESCSLIVGWRHIDRVHRFDTDYITSSVSLKF